MQRWCQHHANIMPTSGQNYFKFIPRSFHEYILIDGSLDRSLDRSIARSLARSLDRSIARSSASYSSLVLKASSVKTLTGERGLKNPIQRTTFHLQRSSGARVMVGFEFALFCLSHRQSEMLSVHVGTCPYQATGQRLDGLRLWHRQSVSRTETCSPFTT